MCVCVFLFFNSSNSGITLSIHIPRINRHEDFPLTSTDLPGFPHTNRSNATDELWSCTPIRWWCTMKWSTQVPKGSFTLEPALSQLNSQFPYFFTIHFSIIIPCTLTFAQWTSFGFPGGKKLYARLISLTPTCSTHLIYLMKCQTMCLLIK